MSADRTLDMPQMSGKMHLTKRRMFILSRVCLGHTSSAGMRKIFKLAL